MQNRDLNAKYEFLSLYESKTLLSDSNILNRGSYMSAHVLLNLSNKSGEKR